MGIHKQPKLVLEEIPKTILQNKLNENLESIAFTVRIVVSCFALTNSQALNYNPQNRSPGRNQIRLILIHIIKHPQWGAQLDAESC